MFVLGCPNLLVTVDHLPLVKIFSDQALENIKKNPPVELQGEIDDVYIPDKASSWKTEFGT